MALTAYGCRRHADPASDHEIRRLIQLAAEGPLSEDEKARTMAFASIGTVGHEDYRPLGDLDESGQAGRVRVQPETRSQGFPELDTEVDMSSDWIIGALALITIGGVLGLSIFHFGVHLRDPKNLEAAKRVAADRASAMTRMSSESVNGRSLRQRLDEAPALNERLGSRTMQSVGLWSLLFDMNWSTLRSSLRLPQK